MVRASCYGRVDVQARHSPFSSEPLVRDFMIWFGNLNRILAAPLPEGLGGNSEAARMQFALERVAERSPGLSGAALLDALAGTGWVERADAERLLPTFRGFDPDRHFAEYLRRLSFRGRNSNEEFREGVRCVVEEITGHGVLDQIGPEPCIRFAAPGVEGVVLAYPEVNFTVSGRTREAALAAIEEMPDSLVVVARNFDRSAPEQLASILHRSGLKGTLMSVNLLLGVRASSLRHQPGLARLLEVLAHGGLLRSADVACLGDRQRARATA
jgi:hypothetical protein